MILTPKSEAERQSRKTLMYTAGMSRKDVTCHNIETKKVFTLLTFLDSSEACILWFN